MAIAQVIRQTFEQGNGILRLIPNFVPRRFNVAGQRLRLHPDDYYALGTNRGSIKERWFSSVIKCMNGPLAAEDEGLSYVLPSSGRFEDKFTLKAAQEGLEAELVGQQLMDNYGGWPMYSKFFDFNEPLFLHLHLDDESAARVGRIGKPECYYFPPQMNNHMGTFPATYFGFDSTVTREQIRERLVDYEKRDTRITELCKAYRIELGTGWYTPPGVLHAPGSVLTYEPQWNSDVNSVYENITANEIYSRDFLVENCPEDKKQDVDYVMSLMDWQKNFDPNYKQTYFRPPIECTDGGEWHSEKWIVYGNKYVSGKELTVYPQQQVTIKDTAAYGCIMIQGHGRFGAYQAESATMLRFGQCSSDEYFVSEAAARKGVTIENHSLFEPVVILKHFGPNNTDAP